MLLAFGILFLLVGLLGTLSAILRIDRDRRGDWEITKGRVVSSESIDCGPYEDGPRYELEVWYEYCVNGITHNSRYWHAFSQEAERDKWTGIYQPDNVVRVHHDSSDFKNCWINPHERPNDWWALLVGLAVIALSLILIADALAFIEA